MSDLRHQPDETFDSLRPAVISNAFIRRYGEDILAWAPSSPRPLALEGVAAVVYQILDGSATIAELVHDIHDIVGVPPAVARSQLRVVVEQLADAGLLEDLVTSRQAPVELDLFPAPPNP